MIKREDLRGSINFGRQLLKGRRNVINRDTNLQKCRLATGRTGLVGANGTEVGWKPEKLLLWRGLHGRFLVGTQFREVNGGSL